MSRSGLASAGLASLVMALAACAHYNPTPRDLDQVAQQSEQQAMNQGLQRDAHADTCGMTQFQSLIGKPLSQIDRGTLPEHARIIAPDTMVTQDYVASRLNIRVSADGKVVSLACY